MVLNGQLSANTLRIKLMEAFAVRVCAVAKYDTNLFIGDCRNLKTKWQV